MNSGIARIVSLACIASSNCLAQSTISTVLSLASDGAAGTSATLNTPNAVTSDATNRARLHMMTFQTRTDRNETVRRGGGNAGVPATTRAGVRGRGGAAGAEGTVRTLGYPENPSGTDRRGHSPERTARRPPHGPRPSFCASPRTRSMSRRIDGPTPLQPMPGLQRALGDRTELWIKREDLGPLAFSGNKLRNLEFLLGAAKRPSWLPRMRRVRGLSVTGGFGSRR